MSNINSDQQGPNGASMDITNILNTKGGAAAAQAAGQFPPNPVYHQQLMHAANAGTGSETPSERAGSPHGSEHSSRYSGPPMHNMNGMMNGMQQQRNRYPSPTINDSTQLPGMMGDLGNVRDYYMANPEQHDNRQMPVPRSTQQRQPSDQAVPPPPPVKAFPCSVCAKGFARRSDLARHERIHSGVRPHVCDYPNCGKQFIQRSALTVHARVHTGEKPHMCERCGKPFSDSSSLARHRRIHSGKRPYKCPYADCQKTFTRRTTLTRHQNHHTGTVEEAAAATEARLATLGPSSQRPQRQPKSEGGDEYSTNATPLSTPSPGGGRTMSMSPNSDMAPLNQLNNGMQRQMQDYPYMNNSSLPAHLRNDYAHHVPSQNAPMPPHQQAYMAQQQQQAPRPTSHPTGYGPPQILEPPANPQSASGSAGGSPHMSNAGWGSPSHANGMAAGGSGMGNNMPSPGQNGYMYPDPEYGNVGHMYYPNSNLRRPQSTEPDQYESKPRINELWQAAQ